MKLKYKHLSDYVGEKIKNGTLNSQFYGLFLTELSSTHYGLTEVIALPQRVPRAGFFTELLSLEERPFRIKFTKTINSLTRRYVLHKLIY
ncbi:MAG: hypothetical protein KIT56_04680 [Gammaproteobacteria bacterium]|nr:hypothetical protein [Gammaproteobacteria bacterium]MCW5583173.1 hypothetical protein [Gammaproteobacteria bacterium]